ncbi:hypothetical protein SLA2020_402690 [Shorea laevis]
MYSFLQFIFTVAGGCQKLEELPSKFAGSHQKSLSKVAESSRRLAFAATGGRWKQPAISCRRRCGRFI